MSTKELTLVTVTNKKGKLRVTLRARCAVRLKTLEDVFAASSQVEAVLRFASEVIEGPWSRQPLIKSGRSLLERLRKRLIVLGAEELTKYPAAEYKERFDSLFQRMEDAFSEDETLPYKEAALRELKIALGAV